ncbi:MAG TPA: DUF3570 domain-containing protein [Gammaproteobacteria bacterium]|nr:DUF3570 domain-containing protein [Gammaproteobacteria bacterium]
MQLKPRRRRRLQRTLLASSCALLGTAPAALADTGDWSFDTGVLFYSEQDRVQAVEPGALVKRDFGDDSFLSAHLVADTLSGATPTGAMPSSGKSSVTVTSPSGKTSTVAGAAGVNPVDPNFHDFRKAISLTWSQPLDRLSRIDLGASYSIEHDFKSQGLNALFSHDFNDRNTTLSLGVAKEWDLVFPIGGLHKPLSVLPHVIATLPPPAGGGDEGDIGGEQGDEGQEGGGGVITTKNPVIAASETKHVNDVLLGVTQVVNKDWLTELNYSYSRSTGYQNDPYKVVSILNTKAGTTPVGEPIFNIYENRPSLHQKYALYWGNKVYLGGDVLDFSYRYGWDDWGIHSGTYEVRYRLSWGGDFYVMPHLRWYRQNAADFYHRGLLDTDKAPPFVSADYRLAAFSARTVGIEFGTRTSGGSKVSLRVERYLQTGSSDPRVDIGVQKKYDLFPDLKADIVQLSFSF